VSHTVGFVEDFIENTLSRLHTAMMGKIEKFDPEAMKADVQLLVKRKYKKHEAASYPLLQEVPVMTVKTGAFVVRPPYQKGDLVMVLFAEREIDAVVQEGTEEEPVSKRRHALEDAVVIGGWMPFSEDLPEDNADDLVIARTDFSARIVIQKDDNKVHIQTDGPVLVEAEEDVEVKTEGDAIVEAEGDVKVEADGEAVIEAADDVTVEAGGDATVTASGEALLEAGGDAIVEGSSVLLGASAGEAAVLGDSLLAWLNGHTHSHPEGPTGSPQQDAGDDLVSGKVEVED